MWKWMSLAILVALSPGAASACGDSIRVTTLLDEDRLEGCTPASCSLREAVALANACRSGNTTIIALAPGRYELHRIGFAHPRTPASTRAPGDSAMIVTGRIRLQGEGAVVERALYAPPFRIFDVAPGAWLALAGVRLSNGFGGAGDGGGVHLREGALLLLDRSQVSGAARFGGGIYAAGTILMREALVQGGRAERGGGLFVALTGNARIERSEFVQNLANGTAGTGGAIEVQGEVAIRDTTFAGNGARHGSAISVWPPGRVRITGGLIVDNAASGGSGALELRDGDEIVGPLFRRNAPQDCVFRYAQDRATRGCHDATIAVNGFAEFAER